MSEPFNFNKLDRPGRPSNAEICAAFRKLLTEGAAHWMDEQTLTMTKPWRNDLWKAFAEIEERLDPLGVETRRRERVASGQD